ncbi:MAG: carboxypeptidase-like regulatory domain-containing protein [Tenacibaculum sp.]
MLKNALVIFVLLSPFGLYAQQISLDAKNEKLAIIFSEINKQTGCVFLYSTKSIDENQTVTIKVKNQDLKKVLSHVFEGKNIGFKISNNKKITLSKQSTQTTKQEHVIKGTVKDEFDEPLPGVSIVEKGTSNGSTTDFNGNFKIVVKYKNTSLLVSYIGFYSQEIDLNGKSQLQIIMLEEATQLNEVVVTALGIKREKKALGYASQSLNQNDLNTGNDANLLNKISGKIAGVQSIQGSSGPGSSTRVVIRGESSFGDNQPLYVVDGVPVINEFQNQLFGTPAEIDYGNGAGELNAEDIAELNVLKGASATALYGSKAANGAIVIKTKDGAGKTGLRLEFSSSLSLEEVARLPKFQNKWSQGRNGVFEYFDGLNTKGTEDHQDISWGREINGELVSQFDSPSILPNGTVLRGGDTFLRNGAAITPTPLVAQPNNVRNFFKTGISSSHHIALSSSSKKSNLRFSYTLLNSDWIIPNTNLERNTFSLNLNHNSKDWLNIKTSVNYINAKSNNRPSLGYGP